MVTHLLVKDLNETTDIEVSVFCSHDRGTHMEEVPEDWSDHAKMVKIEICDHCGKQLLANGEWAE